MLLFPLIKEGKGVVKQNKEVNLIIMNQFKIIIISIFVLVSNLFSQQVYKNNDYNFKINFPDGSEIIKGITSGIIIRSIINDLTEINIAQETKDGLNDTMFAKIGVDNFCNAMIGKFQVMLKDYKTIEYGTIDIKGINAYFLNYTCSDNSRQMNSKQYFFVHRGVLYVITTGCADEEIEKYKPIFKDCVNTFEFMK